MAGNSGSYKQIKYKYN